MAPLEAAGSASSDYFGDDDPAFLEALCETNLSGDLSPPPPAQPVKNKVALEECAAESPRGPSPKRPRESSSEDEPTVAADHDNETAKYIKSDVYGASKFGGFGEYMARKRAKLQIQNAALDTGEGSSTGSGSKIFRGLQIYINGYTSPSVQDLRKLIIEHGGIYHPYLDKKALVTHIVTCSLTPAKIKEFQHMKVARPEWLVDSARAGMLLPWQNFIFKAAQRPDESQGKRVAQKSLLGAYAPDKEFAVNTTKPPPPPPPQPTTSPVLRRQDTSDSPAADVSPLSSPQSGTGSQELALILASPPHLNPLPALMAVPELVPDPAPAQVLDTGPPLGATTPQRNRALHTTNPVNVEPAKRVPTYAANKSNLNAQRAMQDPAWRAAHTSAAPNFVEGYYRNSRLHYLSMWKAELKNLVKEAQEKADRGTVTGFPGAPAVGPENGKRLELTEEDAVAKVVRENMGGNGTGWDGIDLRSGGVKDDDISMRHAHLVLRSPSRKGKGKGKERERPEDVHEGQRVIMHCDFDSFFVSAGLVDRPHLRGKPVVVCHSQGAQGGQSSTSEIASASYEARKFGIKNGMSLQQARKLCPTLITMPYEFQRYKQFSLQFYTILMAHADDLQAVSVDEALVDVTGSVKRIRGEISHIRNQFSTFDPAKEFAEAIRAQVKKATGCEVSIGIAHNIMLARLASRRAKPAGSHHILPPDVRDILAPLDIDDLHGFGYSARQKAQEKLGATNLGELAKKSKTALCDALGKAMGETLHNAIRGIDERHLESDKPRKSVSCDINYGIRFENTEQAEAFVYQLSMEVSRRLNDIDMKGRSMTLKVMKRDPEAPIEASKFLGHGICETFAKQVQLAGGRATSDAKMIGDHAWRLLKSFNFDPKELRGIGIQIQKLEKGSAAAATELVLGQVALPFQPVEHAKGKIANADQPVKQPLQRSGLQPIPRIQVDPPPFPDVPGTVAQTSAPSKAPNAAPISGALELPSFSQVDRSVFDALPEDIRKELVAEYRRLETKSTNAPDPGPSVSSNVQNLSSLGPPLEPPKRRIFVKGTGNTNVKRIAKQFAPQRTAPPVSPQKTPKDTLLTKLAVQFKVNISEAELKELDIDPEVFAVLPRDIQQEQLAEARFKKSGKIGVEFGGPRRILKPIPQLLPRTRPKYVPPPPPKANFPTPPTLKQRGPNNENVYFSETSDVQNLIESWVNAFLDRPPYKKDIEYFSKYLVQCADGSRTPDSGLERALAVAKWWRILLRRHFGEWEQVDEELVGTLRTEDGGSWTSEGVGREWWRAFWDVKEQMDALVKVRFGGCLSLR